ncbi:IclR family transcriptional regulator [Neobacillus bataviensis LMG 21833]|uniref:IclR family transcriptional regulator n=1 Tax=Neobacillus bataviensis LMG 21833 TaxID=1117379 RepID=K6EAC9_9BACI|nr:IclR family transcriptional regulator [Neobacillus bataviensis]EKN70356.1 IclR family transcriptional regulator [Neobacillus bataviensis LMG 21833]
MNQSVIKALKLLSFFSESEVDLSLSELAQRSKLPKATVFRLLSSLEYMGFVVKSKHSDHDVRYRLGLKLLELGGLVTDQLELRRISLPLMKQLQVDINETVHLVIREGDEAVYIEKVESNHALRLYARVGRRSSLSLGSGPQVLLAYLSEAEQERIITQLNFQGFTKNTIINSVELLTKIKEIKEQGFSLSFGEQDEGTIGISYPVFNRNAKVVAALSVSGPVSRLSGEYREYTQRRTKETAKEISMELGYISSRA